MDERHLKQLESVAADFRRAIEHGNLMLAELTVREIGRISLDESLALIPLIALKDPRRRSRSSRALVASAAGGAPGAHDRSFIDTALRRPHSRLWAAPRMRTHTPPQPPLHGPH